MELKTNTFTIIIPTMWMGNNYLLRMLEKYEESLAIKEVIIVNNNVAETPNIIKKFKKIRLLDQVENIYVNPAWNLGVKEATTEKIILMNDDIYIDKFYELLYNVNRHLTRKNVIAPDTTCFNINQISFFNITKPPKQPFGWGTMMFMYKDSYVQVPEDLKVYAGDEIQYFSLVPYAFRGVIIETDMSTTVNKLNIKALTTKDVEIFRSKYFINGILNLNI